MTDFLKRTWAEIDLDCIDYNFSQVRSIISKETKIMCVVKADAYGHGVEFVAREHQKAGADWFGVSNIEEAIQLRRCGITKPVLILGYTPAESVKELYDLDLTQTVFSLENAKELSSYAQKYGFKINVHLKIDTGMSRLGFVYHDSDRDIQAINQIQEVTRLDGLNCEGIFTHFSVADEGYAGRNYTERQYGNFVAAITELENRGIKFQLHHCCNSAATIAYPHMHMDMVRPGIILYGLSPSGKLENKISIKPVMELKTVISMIKTVEEGTAVSYGRTFVSEEDTVVATVPIGYADGYPRSLSGEMWMLVNGKKAPIIGRICMDQSMLDVSGIKNIEQGMTVTVFGDDKGEILTVDELAKMSNTINYEMVCLIGKRVPRIIYKNSQSVGQLNYICPVVNDDQKG